MDRVSRDRAVLFFDVDGTLVDSEAYDSAVDGSFLSVLPAPGVAEAFERIHERGHLAILCTGRPLSMVSPAVMALGFDGSITGAGAHVAMGGQTVFESVIPQDILRRSVELLLYTDAPVMLEARDVSVIVSRTGVSMDGFDSVPVARSLAEVEAVVPDLNFCKFTTDSHEHNLSDEFYAFAREHFDEVDMGFAWDYSMKGVDKGSAVARVLAHVGRGVENTYAFGDSENDLSMFEAVQTGVAMGNAMDSLKARADYVTSHIADGGVLHGLEHFGLI